MAKSKCSQCDIEFMSTCNRIYKQSAPPCARDVEAVDNSLQQLKAEIAALADEIECNSRCGGQFNATVYLPKLRQLSAV
jgi:hypothetical protein